MLSISLVPVLGFLDGFEVLAEELAFLRFEAEVVLEAGGVDKGGMKNALISSGSRGRLESGRSWSSRFSGCVID